jgi:hypothetical protein
MENTDRKHAELFRKMVTLCRISYNVVKILLVR